MYVLFIQEPTANLAYRFFIGFVAGSVASVVNIPFDVAKSRIQGPQPVPGQRKYDGCFRTMYIVYKEEGYKNFMPVNLLSIL